MDTPSLKPEWIIYSDNHLLAVNKPAGMLSQDSGSGKDNLEDRARQWVRLEKNKPGNVFLHAVHRIDKAVSGVVLFARTDKALSRLNKAIRSRDCTKRYLAVVAGTMPAVEGRLEHWLQHASHRAEVAQADAPAAKKCLLLYHQLASSPPYTLLDITLITGYYHQIRAQLAAVGCAIAGDARYGSTHSLPIGSIALHHGELTIEHPTRKTPLTMQASMPSWWKDAFSDSLLGAVNTLTG